MVTEDRKCFSNIVNETGRCFFRFKERLDLGYVVPLVLCILALLDQNDSGVLVETLHRARADPFANAIFNEFLSPHEHFVSWLVNAVGVLCFQARLIRTCAKFFAIN